MQDTCKRPESHNALIFFYFSPMADLGPACLLARGSWLTLKTSVIQYCLDLFFKHIGSCNNCSALSEVAQGTCNNFATVLARRSSHKRAAALGCRILTSSNLHPPNSPAMEGMKPHVLFRNLTSSSCKGPHRISPLGARVLGPHYHLLGKVLYFRTAPGMPSMCCNPNGPGLAWQGRSEAV